MRASVTQIIHNGELSFLLEVRERSLTSIITAWRVDFNVTLLSFEPLISGARNLLDLALNSPQPGGPRALFVSSVSSMRSKSLLYPLDWDVFSSHDRQTTLDQLRLSRPSRSGPKSHTAPGTARASG